MVPVGTTRLWMLRMRASSFFRKRPSSSSCRCAKWGRGGFLPPHHPGQSLGSGGGVSAPKGSLRAGSTFFAGLLQPFVFCHEGLGVVAASNNLSLLNLIVLKIHHSEGGVSASSDASEIQIVSSVHGVRQSLPIHGSLLRSLRGSAGLHAGHGSGFGASPQSWIRLRPYLHDWLFRRPPESRFFFLRGRSSGCAIL